MDQEYLHSLEAVPLEKIVKDEYRIYQIYTLMDRAIPYLQEGLKPSQRRILYTLWRNQNRGLVKVSSLTASTGPDVISEAMTCEPAFGNGTIAF